MKSFEPTEMGPVAAAAAATAAVGADVTVGLHGVAAAAAVALGAAAAGGRVVTGTSESCWLGMLLQHQLRRCIRHRRKRNSLLSTLKSGANQEAGDKRIFKNF